MQILELAVRDDWDRVFDRTCAELSGALGRAACGFDHIGSTSVSGLLAKPVLDVLATLSAPHLPAGVVPAMDLLGFEYRGAYGIEHRHLFTRADCHVHGYRPGEGEWRVQLLFRDHLRADPAARAAYERFKRDTAERVGWDRPAYQRAKDAHVTTLLPAAEAWATAVGWRPPARPAWRRVSIAP